MSILISISNSEMYERKVDNKLDIWPLTTIFPGILTVIINQIYDKFEN